MDSSRPFLFLVLAFAGSWLHVLAQNSTTEADPQVRHHARGDCKPYTLAEFQQYYGSTCGAEWLATPEEKHVANDGVAYNIPDFIRYYGSSSWVQKWATAREATQEKMGKDGKVYTMKEFFSYYGSSWPEVWKAATEQPCAECCHSLNRVDCDSRTAFCDWKWTGDWTTSCVVKFSAANETSKMLLGAWNALADPAVRHYARGDCKPYTLVEFQQYYGSKCGAEWLATPEEKHVANDGVAYNIPDFIRYYGSSSWVQKWATAREATQEKMGKDGTVYTMKEFFSYYGSSWPEVWKAATEQPCAECCHSLNRVDCDSRTAFCDWKWTGDWTTSCVVKFSVANETGKLLLGGEKSSILV